MKTALVTGAAGFIARHLIPELEKTHNVEETEDIEDYIESALDDQELKFDTVVHLGANIVNVTKRMNMGMKAFEDIFLDYAVCQMIEKYPPKTFIVMSSCAIDHPDDPYCTVKRTMEAFAMSLFKRFQRSGTDCRVIIFRPFSGYGHDQSTEYPYRAIWERALAKEDPLTVWGGNQIRDWIHVDDIVAAIMHGIETDRFPAGMPLELGTGEGTTLRELARKIATAAGYTPELHFDPYQEKSSPRRVASTITPGYGFYGWRPKITLDQGICLTAEEYKRQGRL